MRTVALDLSSRKITYCELANGKVVRRATVHDVAALRAMLGPERPNARVAIEACREAWYVHDELTEWGNDVWLVDTTRVKQLGIGHHGRKTDRIDVEVLALALEKEMIPRAHVLSPARRQLRHDLTIRRALVSTRAEYITQIRALVRAAGGRVRSCEVEQFEQHFTAANLDDALRTRVAPLLEIVRHLHVQIATVEERIMAIGAAEPAVAAMNTVPGVGLLVAAAMVSVIDTPGRFASAHKVQSYLGLVPSEYASGQTRRLGSITKKGSGYMRALLVQAAWNILRRPGPDPLKLWGAAIVERRGKCVAVVAVARRLAGLLWAMWRDGTVYDPEELGKRTADGISRRAQSLEKSAAAIRGATRKLESKQRQRQRLLGAKTTEVCSTTN